jgi:hypothetical protein
VSHSHWHRGEAGQKILSFVVQFKTVPCRDSLDVEQRSLYVGTTVYSFNRGINQIGLLSIICSDAFAFTNPLVDDYHRNCLLIHIQLNPNPAHIDYAAYRTHLHSIGSSSHVELLCLNWARGVQEQADDGQLKNWNNVAGSAWYVPPAKFSCDDTLVEEAHRRGLYYSLVSKRWHTFYLNYEPQVILLQKQKLMIHAEPEALIPKSCLTVINRWSWDTDTMMWVEQCEADDGFKTVLQAYSALSADLPAKAAVSPLAVERALELLAGPQGKPSTWFHLQELSSMKVEIEESISRVTVHQESDPTRRGVIFRKARLQRAQDAMTLPRKNIVPWPRTVLDLEGGFQFLWRRSDPHRNAISTDTGSVASLVFLGDQSDNASIESVYMTVLQALIQQSWEAAIKSRLDLTDAVVHARDRLCVVFRKNHVCCVWNPDRDRRIDSPPLYSAVDITGAEG